jgi:hypothetical protein
MLKVFSDAESNEDLRKLINFIKTSTIESIPRGVSAVGWYAL